jgi:fatty-acyl-CoA synthase
MNEKRGKASCGFPRYIQFVDEFPMLSPGKVQKFIMRRMLEQQLGLKRAETA